MALQPIAAILALFALKLRDGEGGQPKVSVRVKGKMLSAGRVGDNGQIIQPTYEMVSVRVPKPPTKLCYKTASKHAFSDPSRPKIQYGVVYYKEDEGGRRQYSYPDGESPTGEGEKIGNVFPARTQGYYIVSKNNNSPNPYGGTGLKGWFVFGDNRNYANSEEDAIAQCNFLFERQLEPQPDPVAPDPPPYTAPTQPDWGLGGGMGALNQRTGTGGTTTPSKPTPPSEPTPPPTGGQEPTPPSDEPKPLPPSDPNPVKPTDPFEPPKGEEPFKPPMKEEPDYKGGVDEMDKYGGIGSNGGGDYKLGGM